jgi:hypothetical protein
LANELPAQCEGVALLIRHYLYPPSMATRWCAYKDRVSKGAFLYVPQLNQSRQHPMICITPVHAGGAAGDNAVEQNARHRPQMWQ